MVDAASSLLSTHSLDFSIRLEHNHYLYSLPASVQSTASMVRFSWTCVQHLSVLFTLFFILPGYLCQLSSLVNIPTATTTDAQGRPSLAGYPTLVYNNPRGIPTITWNCAALPYICNNVDEVHPLNRQTRQIIPSKRTNNRAFVELHYDSDGLRKEQRRNFRCPPKWARKRCVDGDNGGYPIGGYNVGGDDNWAWTDIDGAPKDKAFEGEFFDKNNRPANTPDLAYIADLNGKWSGLIWSCDEFPPAA